MELRSQDLWGGAEGLAREREGREEAREKRKQKKYSKQVKGKDKDRYSLGMYEGRYTSMYCVDIYFPGIELL